jgi:hypothetical protein
MNLWCHAKVRGRLQRICRKNKTAKSKADVHCRHDDREHSSAANTTLNATKKSAWKPCPQEGPAK